MSLENEIKRDNENLAGNGVADGNVIGDGAVNAGVGQGGVAQGFVDQRGAFQESAPILNSTVETSEGVTAGEMIGGALNDVGREFLGGIRDGVSSEVSYATRRLTAGVISLIVGLVLGAVLIGGLIIYRTFNKEGQTGVNGGRTGEKRETEVRTDPGSGVRDELFTMYVEDSFNKKDDKILVTGVVRSGELKKGSKIAVEGMGAPRRLYVVDDLLMTDGGKEQSNERITKGDKAGILLSAANLAPGEREIMRGQVVSSMVGGELGSYNEIILDTEILETAERGTILKEGQEVELVVGTAVVKAKIVESKDGDLKKGQSKDLKLKTETSVVVFKDDKVKIRLKGRWVANGEVENGYKMDKKGNDGRI